MRVAVWHNLPTGGGYRLLRLQIAALAELGHHVELWSPQLDPMPDLPAEICQHASPPARDTTGADADVRAHRRRSALAIREGDFDVFLAGGCRTTTVPALGDATGLPSCLYLNEPTRHLFEAIPLPAWLHEGSRWSPRKPSTYVPRWARDARRLQAVRRIALREIAAARSYDRVLVNSLFSRESVLRAYGVDARVCYPGIDETFFCPDDEVARERFVLGVGQISRHKNVELVIAAIGTVPSERRPTLLWVGNDETPRYTRELIERAGAGGVELRLRVAVTDQDLLELYRRAVALVYTPRLEPFGLVPLEANACGLAVVASGEGGLRETMRHEVNALVAEPTPDGVASSLSRLVDDPPLRQRLGRQGRELVLERWTQRHAGERLQASLQELVSEDARP